MTKKKKTKESTIDESIGQPNTQVDPQSEELGKERFEQLVEKISMELEEALHVSHERLKEIDALKKDRQLIEEELASLSQENLELSEINDILSLKHLELEAQVEDVEEEVDQYREDLATQVVEQLEFAKKELDERVQKVSSFKRGMDQIKAQEEVPKPRNVVTQGFCIQDTGEDDEDLIA